jgi:hypothetical protein
MQQSSLQRHCILTATLLKRVEGAIAKGGQPRGIVDTRCNRSAAQEGLLQDEKLRLGRLITPTHPPLLQRVRVRALSAHYHVTQDLDVRGTDQV